MDYLFIQDFLTTYSLPTLIVAIIVCTVSLTLNKFFDKLPKLLKAYFPFLLAVVLYFTYDMLFVIKDFSFRAESFYGGLVSGSVSAIISSTIKKIAKGKHIDTSTTVMLIESILEGYIAQDTLSSLALDIEKDLSISIEKSLTEEQIVNKISAVTNNISVGEITRLAKLIVCALNSIKKQ